MTNWLPELQKTGKPLYIEIADIIEDDIDSGKLNPGSRLPPLRNIAYDIGVTVGTVSRAYALACERGLVTGEVGRGTYVLDKGEESSLKFPTPLELSPAFLSGSNQNNQSDFGYASAANVGQSELIAKTAGVIAQAHPEKIMDYVRTVPSKWREAGQKWLACGGWIPHLEDIVPTNGAHAACMSAVSSISSPGDKIVFEGLTYCSIARSVALLGRRVIVTDFDKEGIIPEAFEKLCAQQHPKALYLMPSVQNPTLSQLSMERRATIAQIAHRYNVWIIEDEIYGPLVGRDIPPMAHFAPELTFHATGLSKSVSAGVRVGWLACPPRFSTRIANAHKMVTGGASFWLSELASELVLSGEADKILKKVQVENEKRLTIARSILEGVKFRSVKNCPYIWFKLPEPWHSGTFKTALAEQNIVISGEDSFKPTRSEQVFHGARIGLTSPKNAADIEAPLKIIKNLLDSGLAGYDNHG